ncbi:MAG TPA: response regulator, partial [Isosphaeraceae bacterium]|nr:response regulator [Isosphaeraceae bacterium]
ASSPGRGHGSTFRLELVTVLAPVSAKPPRAGGRPSVSLARTPDRRSLRILLVEDNRDTLRYLATVLRQRGHQVVTADRLSTALTAVKEAETPFDLLLSDIELPDGDGLNLMRDINAHGRMAGVAMSGFGSEEDLRQSREAGFFDHLTKPIDLNRLDEAIRGATESEASRTANTEDASRPFRLRGEANSSGEFKIVWAREPESENSSL